MGVGVKVIVEVAVKVGVAVAVPVAVVAGIKVGVTVGEVAPAQIVNGLNRFCGLLGVIRVKSEKLLLMS